MPLGRLLVAGFLLALWASASGWDPRVGAGPQKAAPVQGRALLAETAARRQGR